eukprot:2331450-Lingulodinium_polyedra.AAC.2
MEVLKAVRRNISMALRSSSSEVIGRDTETSLLTVSPRIACARHGSYTAMPKSSPLPRFITRVSSRSDSHFAAVTLSSKPSMHFARAMHCCLLNQTTLTPSCTDELAHCLHHLCHLACTRNQTGHANALGGRAAGADAAGSDVTLPTLRVRHFS